MSVPATGLRLRLPAVAVESAPKLRLKALKPGLPCRKLWILDSRLSEAASTGSGSVARSMSLWSACTRAEAAREVAGAEAATGAGTVTGSGASVRAVGLCFTAKPDGEGVGGREGRGLPVGGDDAAAAATAVIVVVRVEGGGGEVCALLCRESVGTF